MPLSESIFQISYELCKEFPAFTPFVIECEKFHKVMMLYKDVRKLQIRENSDEPKVYRKKAGDDWF